MSYIIWLATHTFNNKSNFKLNNFKHLIKRINKKVTLTQFKIKIYYYENMYSQSNNIDYNNLTIFKNVQKFYCNICMENLQR